MPIASSMPIRPADETDDADLCVRGHSMESPIKSTAALRRRLLCLAAVGAACLSGGCCGMLTSVRYAAPASSPGPGADMACAVDDGCVIPPKGYCGADDCPRLINWPAGRWTRCLGPLFHGRKIHGPMFHGRGDGGPPPMDEAELYPPHSRFHPVPTAPVFAQRPDYEPPQRMLAPVPASPRSAPQAQPPAPDTKAPHTKAPRIKLLPARVLPRSERGPTPAQQMPKDTVPDNTVPDNTVPERVLPNAVPERILPERILPSPKPADTTSQTTGQPTDRTPTSVLVWKR